MIELSAASREDLLALIAALQAQVVERQAQVAQLRVENAQLRERVQVLEARLATDSHTSSQPPVSDSPGAKPHPKSLRAPSGRKPGGQAGHGGHTLALVDQPDEVRVDAPSTCQACGRSLEGVPRLRRERRRVVDLPPVRARVVEHQAETKRCPGCGAETSGQFPRGVQAPAQYGPGRATLAVCLNQAQLLPLERTGEVLAEVFGCPLAEGTLERVVEACRTRLAEAEAAITQGGERAQVAHFDETGLDVGGKSWWLHVASTPSLTCSGAHQKRGCEALDAIGVLPQVRGRAVHDGLASSWQYEQCAHALCNAHHRRELAFVQEQLGQLWAKNLEEVVLEAKQAVDEARGQGLEAVSAEVKREFERRSDAALAAGVKANPPPEPTGKRGRPKRGQAGSLVDRLRERKAATVAFLEDFAVPFDNNQAERDIRMTKVRQKISGYFRTTTGADRFCRIRGYSSTLRKQGIPILAALRQAMVGTPPMPATT